MSKINTLQVTNYMGITFNVVLSKDEDNKTLVTFYDTRYKHTDYGQFISRYYASTLLGTCRFSDGGIKDKGLNLYGSEPNWYIDTENANEVVKFIEEMEK